MDLHHRLLVGKDLIDRIFAAATPELRMKYFLHGFCAVLEKTKNLGHNEAGFRKALNHLQYAKKWFHTLRAVLYLEGQPKEDRDLAPLSKQYHLTAEEAKMLPLRLSGFLQSVTQELSRCNDQKLADEFARIFMHEWQSSQNVIALPKRSAESEKPVLVGAMGA